MPLRPRPLPVRRSVVAFGATALVAATLLVPGSLPAAEATPPVIAGSATNFDVGNGTDKECQGFEIEIEDVTDSQVTYTWPGTPYGAARSVSAMSFPDGHRGVKVVYAASYDGHAWSASTPVGAVNHFGVHVTGTPGLQFYTWLCDEGGSGAGSTGSLLEYGGTTPGNFYASPGPAAVVPGVQTGPGGEAVVPQIVPAELPDPQSQRLPDAVWVLKYQASSPDVVDVDQLMADDPEVRAAVAHSQISRVAELFQPDPVDNGGVETEPGDSIDPGDRSSLTVTETYRYTGPIDYSDNSVTCSDVRTDAQYCGNYVGALVSRQMQSTLLANPTSRVGLSTVVRTGSKVSPLGGTLASADLPGNANPDNLACGADGGACTLDVDAGTPVDLTATPQPGYEVSGWTGACSGTAPTCRVVMSGDRSVGVTFVAAPRLAVSLGKPGRVTSSAGGIDCQRTAGGVSGTCQSYLHRGSAVTLTATPPAGHTFAGWTGACLGTTGPVCTVTMSANKKVGATFG